MEKRLLWQQLIVRALKSIKDEDDRRDISYFLLDAPNINPIYQRALLVDFTRRRLQQVSELEEKLTSMKDTHKVEVSMVLLRAINCLQVLGVMAFSPGDKNIVQEHFDKGKNLLDLAPRATVFLELRHLSFFGLLMLRLGQVDEARIALYRAQAGYERLRSQKAVRKNCKKLFWTPEEFCRALKTEHVYLLQLYFEYYQALGNHASIVVSAVAFINAAIKCLGSDDDDQVLLLIVAIGVACSKAAIKLDNFAQSSYILAAMKLLLEQTQGQGEVRGMLTHLQLMLVSHIVNLLLCSKKIVAGRPIWFPVIDTVRQIEGLQVPIEDETLGRLLKTPLEVEEAFLKAQRLYNEVSDDESCEEDLLKTLKVLFFVVKETYPFLKDI